MARTKQILLDGVRLNDFIATGILSETLPMGLVKSVLEKNDKLTLRNRKLPREFLVYYIVAMALFSNVNIRAVLKALLEGLSFLFPSVCLNAACESAISQSRERLGFGVMKDLFDLVCKPIADEKSKGAWYRSWRLVGIDGSHFDLPDEKAIVAEFPKHSNGVEYPYPQLRFVALVELGTRCMFAVAQGNDNDSEKQLAERVIPQLRPDMLLLGDRYYMGYDTFVKATATGAKVLLRAKANLRLTPIKRLSDNSYLAKIYNDRADRKRDGGIVVRVIEFRVTENGKMKKETYRLVTNILEPDMAPALELVKLYCERWGIETTFAELKTRLKLPGHNLRSKRPDLIIQEFWGFVLAHYIIRVIMHRAARANDIDPDDIGFLETVNIVKRRCASAHHFPPQGRRLEGTLGRSPS